MDLIYRKGKHRATLERVRKMHATPATGDQAEETLQNLVLELGHIIEGMRSDQDYDASRIHYILLFSAVVISGIAYVVSSHALLTSLLILLCLVFYIWLSHRIMRSTISGLSELSEDLSDINRQLELAQNGLVIKKRRLLLLSLFYILFFPILLILLRYLGLGPVEGIHPFWNLLIAIIISTAMWVWYFNLSFDQYDEIEETLDLIREKVE